MAKSILITGSNENYLPLVHGLLASVEEKARSHSMDIGLLDLGLSTDSRHEFQSRRIKVVSPDWDYSPDVFHAKPGEFFIGLTARPHLPRYFPSYDVYFWLDADTWVQDWNGVLLYISTAAKDGFAIVPECDRSYSPFYGQGSVIGFRLRCFQRCLNDQAAQRLALFPLINAGVFAARADAPHWQQWSKLLGQIFNEKREPFFFSDQVALNVIIRTANRNSAFLPATYNWMCNRAIPMCSEDGRTLLEPNPPFEPLKIIHLTANFKNGRTTLVDVAGNRHQRSLRFRGYDDAHTGADVELPV